jgi:hypothetical protein
MYIAMNRFRVNAGHEEVFEEMWRRRDSYLDQVPGFKAFRLLRGETAPGSPAPPSPPGPTPRPSARPTATPARRRAPSPATPCSRASRCWI